MTAPRHIVCVTGLVLDPAGRILLIRNERGWEMPGGQVEVGEDPLDALRREVKEEAGCDIHVGRLFGLYSNLTLGLVLLAFHCSYAGGVVHAGMECIDAAWYEPVAAVEAAGITPAADRIRDGLAGSATVVLRSYSRDESGTYTTVAEGLI